MFDVLAIALVQFITPSGARVDVNPAEISSVRESRGQMLAEGVKCVLGMNNGKFISLGESCSDVRRKLSGRDSSAPCVTVCGGERP